MIKQDDLDWAGLRNYALSLVNGVRPMLGVDPEDIAHDALEGLLRSLPLLDASIEEEDKYVRGIVRRQVAESLRSSLGRTVSKVLDRLSDDVTGTDIFKRFERAHDVASLMRVLKPNQRIIVEMVYLKGMSRLQVAEVLGCHKSWVNRQVTQALHIMLDEAERCD